jgi:hypothetical protein
MVEYMRGKITLTRLERCENIARCLFCGCRPR